MFKIQNLENKVVWVTGSSRGIGLKIAIKLVNEGAKVAICGRSKFDNGDLVNNFGLDFVKNKQVRYYQVDFENSENIIEIYNNIKKDFGQIDILVNNAGIGIFKPFRLLTLSEFDSTINVNLRSVFVTTSLLIKDFIELNKGMIINILSVATEKTFKNSSIYAASKSAIKSMMNVIREENRKNNIDIINIYPGATSTDIWEKEYLEEFKYRMIEASDIANVTKDVILNCLNNNLTIEDVVIRPKLGDL